jgi:hypothetical protein
MVACKNCKWAYGGYWSTDFGYTEASCEHPSCFRKVFDPFSGVAFERTKNYDTKNKRGDCADFVEIHKRNAKRRRR